MPNFNEIIVSVMGLFVKLPICASVLLEVSMDFSNKCDSKEARMNQLVVDGCDFTVVFADQTQVAITYADADDYVAGRVERDPENPVHCALYSIDHHYKEHTKSCAICQAHEKMLKDLMRNGMREVRPE